MSIGVDVVGGGKVEFEAFYGGELSTLADAIMETSVIAKPRDATLMELKTLLSKQPLNTQKLWLEALKARIVSSRAPSLECQCRPDVRLSIAMCSGKQKSCSVCGREVAPLDSASGHEAFREARVLNRSPVWAGESTRDALEQRFGVLMRSARQVVVVDRFAIVDADRSERKSEGSSGLWQLLSLASRSGVPQARVFVTKEGRYRRSDGRGSVSLSADQVAARATDLLGAWRLGGLQVEVLVVPESKEMHDRWIGVTWSRHGNASWSVGKGATQFDGDRIEATSNISRVADIVAWRLAAQCERRAVSSAVV